VQLARDGGTDAPAGAGDQHHLVLQWLIHGVSL
jgi:hypothetical protein